VPSTPSKIESIIKKNESLSDSISEALKSEESLQRWGFEWAATGDVAADLVADDDDKAKIKAKYDVITNSLAYGKLQGALTIPEEKYKESIFETNKLLAELLVKYNKVSRNTKIAIGVGATAGLAGLLYWLKNKGVF